MIELLLDPSTWVALFTLTALEVVLGVDNLVVLAVLVSRLPRSRQQRARTVGLMLAMGTRIVLLFSIAWLASLTQPWLRLFDQEISGRDMALIGGGLFLLAKSVLEIHSAVEGSAPESTAEVSVRRASASFVGVITQIALIDIVFSLDSVITAVGMSDDFAVMATAVIVAVVIMLFASGPVARFVNSVEESQRLNAMKSMTACRSCGPSSNGNNKSSID